MQGVLEKAPLSKQNKRLFVFLSSSESYSESNYFERKLIKAFCNEFKNKERNKRLFTGKVKDAERDGIVVLSEKFALKAQKGREYETERSK